MSHPLHDVINDADGFVIIGDSSNGRFPGVSYAAYTHVGKRFYCLDLGGLTEARGPAAGGKVYTSVAELPAEHSDLAILWVTPSRSLEAVNLAHEAGCTRIWFSFKTGHVDAVARAKELGMEVIEVGRCPVYYLEGVPTLCKVHSAMTKMSGTYARPPQTEPDRSLREMW
jgi:hypothetical protein